MNSTKECCGISTQRLAMHFGKSSATYEHEATFHHELAQGLGVQLETLGLQPQTILEIGSHTGILTRTIRELYPKAKLFCADIQIQGFQNIQRDSQTFFIQANGEKLPFPKGTFDLIVSGATFQWFCHWKESLECIFKLLKPRGVLAFSQFLCPSLEPLRTEADKLGRANSFLKLMEFDEVGHELQHLNAHCYGELKSRCDHHPNLRSILTHLRNMGVGASSHNEQPWSRSQLVLWEKSLEQYRSSLGLPLNYCAGLFWTQRPQQ
jgi:malonyl-CoA O-methyltransferase